MTQVIRLKESTLEKSFKEGGDQLIGTYSISLSIMVSEHSGAMGQK